jgi:flagellar hook protein FlgE
LTVGTAAIPPEQTGWSTLVNAGSGGLAISVNLDNRDHAAITTGTVGVTPPWTPLDNFAWDTTFNVNMFNYQSPATIYDQAGTAHTLTNYFVRLGDSGMNAQTWRVYTVIDGEYCVAGGPGGPTDPNYFDLVFNSNGTLNHIEDSAGVTVGSTRLPLDLSQTVSKGPAAATPGTPVDMMAGTGAAPPNYDWFTATAGTAAFYMDLSETTQFGMPNGVNYARQDGYTAGTMTQLTVSRDGHLVAGYSNGQTKTMGQVLLVEFSNPHGLQRAGDNLWIETWDSGQPAFGEPGGGTRGIIQGNAVEESNTDLTQELVNMIVYQRNYQANAQTIRTQDQILQTLVNLR